ncbi:hypothetical protein EDB89DRAFT_1907216 [Lactarius sanguifluus]|nr:hypothetical protein EDB89DRAFT_1907216 [Lactarius sanguifluus]
MAKEVSLLGLLLLQPRFVQTSSRNLQKKADQPTQNDPPLSLATLKPLLLQGGPSSTFGFARGVDPTDEAVDARGDPRVDDREVAPHTMEDEFNIDKASPDEDERQAQQFLRSPTLRRNAIRSPEENPHPPYDEHIQPHVSREGRDPLSTSHGGQRSQSLLSPEDLDEYDVGEGQGSQSVLQVYQQKNGAIRPPNPDALLAHAGQPLGGTSNTPGNVAKHHRTATSLEDQDNSDSSDDDMDPVPRTTRTFKPVELAKPTHLCFYSGVWHDVLIAAKNYNRLCIHAETGSPFPDHKDGLQYAHECILEVIGCLEDGLATIDDPIYCTYKHDMIVLVYNDGSTHRGRMKNMARAVVKKCFSKELEPRLSFGHNCIQEQQVISEAVKAVIRGSQFLRKAELDENQHMENFAHPAIIELCKQFYYSGKSDCLSVLFPNHFISNCLSKWESGIQETINLTSHDYEPVYIAMLGLINDTLQNDYHGRKLRDLLKRIAKDGRTRVDVATIPSPPLLSTLINLLAFLAEWSWILAVRATRVVYPHQGSTGTISLSNPIYHLVASRY